MLSSDSMAWFRCPIYLSNNIRDMYNWVLMLSMRSTISSNVIYNRARRMQHYKTCPRYSPCIILGIIRFHSIVLLLSSLSIRHYLLLIRQSLITRNMRTCLLACVWSDMNRLVVCIRAVPMTALLV